MNISQNQIVLKYSTNISSPPLSVIRKNSFKPGMSLIEIMVFVVVLSVAVIGTSSYRYFSMLDIRLSDTEITAGRIGAMLCESWRGRNGDVAYNPLDYPGPGFNITSSSSSLCPSAPSGFTVLGYYKVVSDNHTYYVTLSYCNINSSLRSLNVIASWPACESTQISSAQTNKKLCLSSLIAR